MKSHEFINEAVEDEGSNEKAQMVKDAWMHVMPNSAVSARKILGGWTFRFFLTKDQSECANGIRDNDPLYYAAHFDRDGTFKESHGYLLVKPTVPNMAYSSERFRLKSTKNPTYEQLVKRFTNVRNFIMSNADKLKDTKFNIADK